MGIKKGGKKFYDAISFYKDSDISHVLQHHESGRKDRRLRYIAIPMWVSLFIIYRGIPFFHIAPASLGAIGVIVCMFIVIVGMWRISAHFSHYKFKKYWWKITLLAVALMSSMAISSWDIYLAQRDPIIYAYGQKSSHIRTKITGPWLFSHRGCFADGVVESISIDKLHAPSKAYVKLSAPKERCERLKNYSYSTITLSGKIEKDPFGLHQAAIKDVNLISVTSSPPWYRQAVMYMWNAFIEQCAHLSQQALILVPGITIGVLGNRIISDFHSTDTISSDLQKKAQHIEKDFKSTGITHLLAVSGGHFIIIAELLRRILSRRIFFSHISRFPLKVHRYLMSFLIGISMIILAFVMAPSDSVIRALIMGVLLATTIYGGRPYQSESALWWTIVAVLLINPTFSYRLGFIFSCAAVFGIVWTVDFIKKGIHLAGKALIGIHLPQWIKEALAVTTAAQVATFPIQMAIDPIVSPLSLIINIIVAPVMTIATIAGLFSLFTSWIFPWIGWISAYISGLGTAIIAFIAHSGALIQNHLFAI